MLTKEQEINEVINDIRPGIQMDGGDIEFISFNEDTGVVEIRLHGACVGCPMSSVTLKQGVEYMIKEVLDFVKEVVDVTDHDDTPIDYIPPEDSRLGFRS